MAAAVIVGTALALTNAGTTILNTATVTYSNAAGQPMTPLSATVRVTVQAVNKVIVVGNTNAVVPGGSKALLYFTVTNVGNIPDTYNLATAIIGLNAGANPANITVGNIFSIPSNTVGGASGAVVTVTPVLAQGSSAVFAVEVSAIPSVAPDLNYNINLTATSANVITTAATGVDTITTANYKLVLVKTIQNITQDIAQGGIPHVYVAPWTITIGKGDVIEYTDTIENASNGANPVPVDMVTINATVWTMTSASVALVALTASGPVNYNPPPASAQINNTSVEVIGIPGPITLAQPFPDNRLSVNLMGNPPFVNDIIVRVNASASALIPGKLNVGDKVKIRYRVIAY